jgi:diaminopimelate decarboxylase
LINHGFPEISPDVRVENGVDRLIRRRETFEDLIALEEEFIK